MSKYYELTNETIVEYINKTLDFFDKDAEYFTEEIGDGNLNLVFRVRDEKTGKSLIAKQALPYVRAAGEDWPLDIERGVIETKILEIEYKLTEGLVPKVYKYDLDMYVMIMEDLSDYQIMRYGLIEGKQYPHFADQISDFLVKTLLLTSDVVLNHQDKKQSVKEFINPELCDITEDLVYTEPYFPGERNEIEEALLPFIKENLWNDNELKLEAAKLKFDFMNNAQALLHGDLHTGSIFVNAESTKVIDPEFAFYGPIAYDTGALMANLIMNYISSDASFEGDLKVRHKDYLLKTIKDTVDLFIEKFLNIFDDVATDKMAKVPGFKNWYLQKILVDTAGVTGAEMIRRTVGFAQVKDLNDIKDDTLRIKAKETNVLMAKELVKSRKVFVSGDEYVNLIKKYF